MKVFFNNNVPAPLRSHLNAHEVQTAHEMGWHTLENGDLLRTAERGGFVVLVTADQNLSYQQNLTNRKLALVVLEQKQQKFCNVKKRYHPERSKGSAVAFPRLQ